MKTLLVGAACALALCLVAPTVSHAQDFRGRINGTVTDNSGAVLPGVTVTTTSPALIQPQVQVPAWMGRFAFWRCRRACTK